MDMCEDKDENGFQAKSAGSFRKKRTWFIVFSYIPYNSIKLVVICYSKCSYLSLYFLSQSKDLTILIFPKNQLLWDFFPKMFDVLFVIPFLAVQDALCL